MYSTRNVVTKSTSKRSKHSSDQLNNFQSSIYTKVELKLRIETIVQST